MSEKSEQQAKYVGMQRLVIALGVLAMVLAAVIAMLLLRPATVVGNFKQCKDAGGQLSGASSEQCLIGGATFAKEQAAVPPKQLEGSGSEYVGLAEEAALEKAKAANTPARVVERDGQPLPATSDFREGRLNMTVQDGKVTRVDIEGQGADTRAN